MARLPPKPTFPGEHSSQASPRPKFLRQERNPTFWPTSFLDSMPRKLPWKRSALERPSLVFGVQTKDKVTYAGVFDFADRLSHQVDWDPYTVQEALRPLIREVRAVLAEAGPEALVFLAADHGHNRLQGGRAVYIDDADDVGYHAGYVTKRVEGQSAAHVFQIPARTLGHNLPGLFVFPKPGFYLRRASDTSGRPARRLPSWRPKPFRGDRSTYLPSSPRCPDQGPH